MPIGAVQMQNGLQRPIERTSDRARRDLTLTVRRINATSTWRRDSCTEVSRSAWQSADRHDDATDATERTDDSERGKIGHSSEHRAGNNRRPGEAAEFTGETCCSQIPCVGRGRLELTTERWHWEMWRRRSCLRTGKFHFGKWLSLELVWSDCWSSYPDGAQQTLERHRCCTSYCLASTSPLDQLRKQQELVSVCAKRSLKPPSAWGEWVKNLSGNFF